MHTVSCSLWLRERARVHARVHAHTVSIVSRACVFLYAKGRSPVTVDIGDVRVISTADTLGLYTPAHSAAHNQR